MTTGRPTRRPTRANRSPIGPIRRTASTRRLRGDAARRRAPPTRAIPSRAERRRWRAADDRPHRRHRRRQVRGSGRLRAPWRRDDLERRGRPRAARLRAAALTAHRALGAEHRPRRGRRPDQNRGDRLRGAPTSSPGSSPRSIRSSGSGSGAGSPLPERGARLGRGPASLRVGDAGVFETTVAVVASDPVRPARARPGARAGRRAGGPQQPLAGREGLPCRSRHRERAARSRTSNGSCPGSSRSCGDEAEDGDGGCCGRCGRRGSLLDVLRVGREVGTSPGVGAAARHEDIIRAAGAEKGVDASLIAAVIPAESRFRDQTPKAGARASCRSLRPPPTKLSG